MESIPPFVEMKGVPFIVARGESMPQNLVKERLSLISRERT